MAVCWGAWRGSVVTAALLLGCDDGAGLPRDGGMDAGDGGMDAGDVVRVPVCAEDAATDAFCCPVGWVAYAHGGCGPAVLLCAPDGGAAPGACDGVDISRPTPVRDEDGAESVGFFRQPDGRIGGAWSTPWPCPQGWRQERDGTCAPTLRDDCPVNTAPLPDGTCTETGYARCGDGWPEVPEEARGQRVIYVRDRASRTPDGTRDAPYPSLMEAIEANPEVKWFLIAPGVYRGAHRVTGELHIVGACAAQVRLATPDGSNDTAFVLAGDGARLDLRDLSLSGAWRHLYIDDGGTVDLRRVHVAETTDGNAIVINGRTSFRVRNTLFAPRTRRGNVGPVGRVILANAGASIDIADSAFVGLASPMLTASADDELTISNTTFENPNGTAVEVRERSRLLLRACAFRRSLQPAIFMAYGSRATLEDVDLSDLIEASFVGNASMAIMVDEGPALVARRLRLRRISSRAIGIRGSETVLDAQDVSIEGVRPDNVTDSVGIDVAEGTARLRRVALVDTARIGILCQQFAACDIRDVLVRGVRATPDGDLGIGIALMMGGTSRVERALIEGAALSGIGAVSLPERITRALDLASILGRPVDPIVRVVARDVILNANRPASMGAAFGIVAAAGATIDADRIAVVDSRGVGIAAADTGYPTRELANAFVRADRLRESDVAGIVRLLGPTLDGPSEVSARRMFVRGMSEWWYGYTADVPDQSPPLRASIGAYVGPNCRLALEDFVIDGAGTAERGALSFGRLALSRGVIAGHRGCALTASNDAAGRMVRVAVREEGNAREGVCIDDALPDLRVVVGRE